MYVKGKINMVMGSKPHDAAEAALTAAEVLIDEHNVVVYNDDVNTFAHVISTLIRVCKHTPEQAEQCTWLIHYKGKCVVKSGGFAQLVPVKEAICAAGIEAKIV